MAELASISKNLEEICSKYNNFKINVEKIKLIPKKSYVRVVVLEVSDESGILKKISSQIVEKIGGRSKPPHITLCRVRRVSDKKSFVNGLLELKFDDKSSFDVESINLIKSELSKTGPKYSVLNKFELK